MIGIADQFCKHCMGPLSIRNPSGFCDHLYYPDYCVLCYEISKQNELKWRAEQITTCTCRHGYERHGKRGRCYSVKVDNFDMIESRCGCKKFRPIESDEVANKPRSDVSE